MVPLRLQSAIRNPFAICLAYAPKTGLPLPAFGLEATAFLAFCTNQLCGSDIPSTTVRFHAVCLPEDEAELETGGVGNATLPQGALQVSFLNDGKGAYA